jgi:hypothetical protein
MRRKRVPLTDEMTDGRRRWLERLEWAPGSVYDGDRYPAASECTLLGWTEFDIRTKEGEPITEAEAIKTWGPKTWFEHVKISEGERLTERGRDALRKARIGAK